MYSTMAVPCVDKRVVSLRQICTVDVCIARPIRLGKNGCARLSGNTAVCHVNEIELVQPAMMKR